MRGFPLVRSLIVLVIIAVASLALLKLTKHKTAETQITKKITTTELNEIVPFILTLSSPAKSIKVSDEKNQLLFEKKDDIFSDIENQLSHLPKSIHLEISWTDSTSPHYFAKISLEPRGKQTLIHNFDSPSNIDDIWELP
jgi:hypothetical protein